MRRARCRRRSESEIEVEFAEPQWAVTPGQSVVLYDGEVCLGGGGDYLGDAAGTVSANAGRSISFS